MEIQKQPLLQDLYLNLNQRFETLHLKRCNLGEEGFEVFAQKSMQPFIHEAITPDYWLFHYQFTPEQLQHLPALSGPRSRELFTTLLPSLLQERITPKTILPMARALGLEHNDKPLLTPVYDTPITPLCSLFHQHNDLSLILAPFNAYTSVKTAQGTLLFSPTKKGGKLLEGFMQHVADNFYTPHMPEERLEVGFVPAFDPQLRQYADRCPKFDYSQQEGWSIPQEAFVPEALLTIGAKCLKFEMDATSENLEALILPHSRSGLHCSQKNYDIMSLQRVAQGKYMCPPSSESSIYTFSYFNQLLQHDRQLRKPEVAATPEQIMLGVQRLASDIIRRDFGQIRGMAHHEAQEQQLHLPEFEVEQPRKGRSL